ncbi:MAG TPA: hypothetical protein VGH33_22885 [Isosphaeraceae bacterium]
MANANSAQASDQVKLVLRWIVTYRFWLILGLSALLPAVGYAIGSGPIQDETKKKVTEIKGADSGLGAYMSPNVPNDQWKPIVDEKKAVVTEDVNKAWTRLYEVQAPLLKWPEIVEARFHEWGRKWPENVDLGAIQKAIDDYVNAYEKAVDETYAKVNPWDFETGKGIVVVPDKMALLRPSVFDPAQPPSLNKVWSAQERLWIQGTLLDAVAKINGKAKDWDGAVVKQINMLEVGSPVAQDQKSLVEGKTVEVTPEIVAPGGTPAAAAAEASATSGMSDPSRMMGGGMPGMPGTAAATEDVYLLKVDSTQYTVVPVSMTALIDQNRLQEFLVGLENSPMAIQILEFEMLKPVNPVTKPVKGEMPTGMMGMMGSSMMGGGMMAMKGMRGGMMRGPGGMMGGPGMNEADMSRMMGPMMGPRGMGGVSTSTGKKGTDVRTKDRAKEREEREKKRKALGRAVDMYYDIVEVTVYGQARFYNPPPPPPAAEPASPGAPATDAAKAEEPKKDEAKKDEAKPEEAKAAEAKKAEEKSGEPKADEASKKEEAKPAEAKKEEAKPAEAAKPAEGPKPEPSKTDAAKPADATKPESKPAEPGPGPKS